ncbi:2,3-bisphosphoglycerate-independent phosphoglycerate mutase [Alphaproteobacteria bacterium LSUCC0684]
MTDRKIKKPVILFIMDGWGHREDSRNNAVRLARTPTIDRLEREVPKAFLLASGPAVGLPEGQVGNSEVGHMTIGAGRIILQDLARIDAAVADRTIGTLPHLDRFADDLKKSGGAAHLMGLVSPGGVHSRDSHLMALAEALVERGIKVWIHAFTDGRDTLPKLAGETLPAFAENLPDGAHMATVTGRYYAMDRDRRWERTAAAWEAITHARADHYAATTCDVVEAGYSAGLGDEFLLPAVIEGYEGMADGDGLVMANFRADRVRQILAGWLLDDPDFRPHERPRLIRPIGLVPYSDQLDTAMDALFGPPDIPNTLGEVVARAGLSQLRLAETEKYPHVTFFFNGGMEESRENERRELVPSPKVATYDLQPEMSANGVRDILVDAIRKGQHDLIIVNFANPDMVGHTGDLNAAIKAVETVDQAVADTIAALDTAGGVMLLTADHGNCEIMWDDDAQSPHTAHSYNPVPVYLIGGGTAGLRDGGLSDIAPTLLDLLGLDIPQEMTGSTLLT